jgi:hypothetical protein
MGCDSFGVSAHELPLSSGMRWCYHLTLRSKLIIIAYKCLIEPQGIRYLSDIYSSWGRTQLLAQVLAMLYGVRRDTS